MIEPGAFKSSTFEEIFELVFNEGTLVANMDSSHLEGFENVGRLIIEGIDLNGLQANLFSSMTKVSQISIWGITDQKMDLEKVVGMFHHEMVRHFLTSDNWIETIPQGLFDRMPNLEMLSFQNSQVTTIDAGAFNGLPKLQDLTLIHNKITSYPSGLFDEVASREGVLIHVGWAFMCSCSLLELEVLTTQESTKGSFHSFFFTSLECYNTAGNYIFFSQYKNNCI